MSIKETTNLDLPAVDVIGETEIPASLASSARGLEDQARLRREAAAEAAARRDSERPVAPRTRRTRLGGAQLKLDVVGRISGYHLYWENDQGHRLELLLEEGFEFVKPSEVGMARASERIVVDSEVTDRVSKHVGTTDDGKPMRAYLLKCPDEIWEEIQESITSLTDQRDRDILDSHNTGDDRYKPKGYDTKIKSGRR